MKRIAIFVVAVLLAISGAGVCLAANPVSYTLEQSGTGYADLSVDQSYSPVYSVHMGTVTTSDKAAIVFSGGMQLQDITSLSYWTYIINAGSATTPGELAPWLAIYLQDSAPDCTYDSWIAAYGANSSDPTLFYIQAEPYYATGFPPLNVWQQQDAFGATPLTWVGMESPDLPHEAPPLSAYISGAATAWVTGSHGTQAFASREYGSLYVCAIKIRMGYGSTWANTEAYVDQVTINGAVQSFEVPVPAVSHLGLAALAIALLLAGLVAVKH